jgi:hypothetical protein
MKLAKSLLLVIFTWFATASNFALASMVYTYAGDFFTYTQEQIAADFSYTPSMSITGSVELPTALADDAVNIKVTPISYSFFDGNQTLTQASTDISADFTFTTIAGEITDWTVTLNISTPSTTFGDITERTINTLYSGDIGSIAAVGLEFMGLPSSDTDFGSNDKHGDWTASAVPLPATVWLFGSGLVGLFGLAKRKK